MLIQFALLLDCWVGLILNLRILFPFGDGDIQQRCNGRSPANGQASKGREWIVGRKNGRDYRDLWGNRQST